MAATEVEKEIDWKQEYHRVAEAMWNYLGSYMSKVSFEMQGPVIEDSFGFDGYSADVLIAGIRSIARKYGRLNCGYCGKFIPKSHIFKASGYELPSWACDWECPHCGHSDGNY